MSYQPGIRPASTEFFVSPYSHSGYLQLFPSIASAPASAAYPAATRAHYYPIVIRHPCIVYRFFWVNGATAATDDIQVGIYNDNDAGTDGPGTSFLLGTRTIAAGANACQFDNVTDTAIYPGRYWLAIWAEGTANNTLFRCAPTATLTRAHNGYLESSLASGLPATATPAQNTTPYVPVFGFTTIASP